MKNKNVLYMTQAAMIAALYVVLTLIANALGLANHAVQLRFSEALTILPFFTPAAIPGLFVGCIISNLLAGGIMLDVVFGSIATLIGAFGTYALRKAAQGTFARRAILTIPPVLANTIIVPIILKYGYGLPTSFAFNAMTVCIGEILSCAVLGLLLICVLEKYKNVIFRDQLA